MDDPWGSSPWADEVQLPTVNKAQGDAPRPRTPVRIAKLGPEEKTNSPWGDDDDNDGFEDWAALPGDQKQTLGLDGAADDDWGQADTGDLTITKSAALSMGWGAHDVLDSKEPSSPDLNLSSKAPTLMRQPTPDPWAQELQSGGQELVIPQVEGLRVEHGREELNGAETAVPQALQSSIETLEASSNNEHEETAIVGDGRPGHTTKESDTRGDEESVLDEEARSEDQDNDPVSRPSSSPSERSHHDGLPQESPRTSFDEEPKPNRPQVPRKVSTKVHELVEHFDTLAKEDIDPSMTRTFVAEGSKAGGSEEEDEFGDFGDFEEGQSDDEGAKSEDSRSIDRALREDPGNRPTQHQLSPTSETALAKDYGIVKYNFDASSLDSIFPDSTPDATTEAIFIPDSLPYDSFSSTEQRKTWYRISRYGTMRKHNTGNDENYIRAGWKPSSVRDDTLKIVSRWIEEDRISGRVVLGGGSKASTVFGWNDPKAAAVPLSDVFVKHGKKMSNLSTTAVQASEVPREWPKGLTRESSASKTRASLSEPRRASSLEAVSVPAPSNVQSSSATPVANFGWNSSSDTNPNVSSVSSGKRSAWIEADSESHPKPGPPASQSIPAHISALSVLPPSQDVLSPVPTVPVTKDARSLLPIEQKISAFPSLSMSTVFSEDDDWGEMVSTPATPTLPVIPTSKSLRHKKSQSFGGSTALHTQGLTSQTWRNDVPETIHQSRSSFDATSNSQAATPFSNQHVIPNVDLSTLSSTQAIPSQAPAQMQSESSSALSDPWASADFSFFETAPAPSTMPVASPISKAAESRSVKVNPSPPPRRNQKSKEELEQEKIVQTVVRGLPDLSYMLRK
ncbi:hypothetical protein VTL71DRAFT_5733 [Oculimacula yallundae]|uniref:Uncharacterized protein n=1 Tax=Oculimacula yallundae TaxID=86028 RepID=A0ABR4BZJ0_9HELO